MNVQAHEQVKGTIWELANRLRGPYRPPQYRHVMRPMVVLRRLDCILQPTKDKVLKEHARLLAQSLTIQRRITQYLDGKTARIDALIAAAVAGQLDVAQAIGTGESALA